MISTTGHGEVGDHEFGAFVRSSRPRPPTAIRQQTKRAQHPRPVATFYLAISRFTGSQEALRQLTV